MVGNNIFNAYIKILKEGWKPSSCRHISNGVYAFMLMEPYSSNGTTVWLVPVNYKPKPLNSRVSEQIYRAYERMNGDGY